MQEQPRQPAACYFCQVKDALGTDTTLANTTGAILRDLPMHVMALPTCAYTAYGFAVSGKSRIGFNGEFREPVSGLYHLGNGHRTFSPTLMRFLSPDNFSPFRQGGLNTYAYCLGDPINLTDPQGTSPFLKGVAKTLKNIFIPGDSDRTVLPYPQTPTRTGRHVFPMGTGNSGHQQGTGQ